MIHHVEITEECRLYRTAKGRRIAVRRLMRQGYTYFVGFRDINKDYPAGLSFAKTEWSQCKDVFYKGSHIIH